MIGWYQTELGVCFHSPAHCRLERHCAVHKPSKKNLMRDWPFVVRRDKGGLMERTCEHGVGHPDRDSLKWLRRFMSKPEVRAMGIHGCDGCCAVV
jgi:hypothetical protein